MSAPEHLPYAGVVAALTDAREAPATARFDAVLAAAVTAGAVDPEVARALRWWQRASVREVSDHVKAVVPVVLGALAGSAEAAAAAVAAADEAWRSAGGHDPLAGNPTGAPADEEPGAGDDPGPPYDGADATPAGDEAADGPASDEAAAEHADGAQPEDSRPADPQPRVTDPIQRRRLVVAGLTRTG